MSQLVLERDILLALLLWETSLRGNNCGRVMLSDFFPLLGEDQLLPLNESLPSGYVLTLRPNGTKTVKGQRSGPFNLMVGEDRHDSCLGRLPPLCPAEAVCTTRWVCLSL